MDSPAITTEQAKAVIQQERKARLAEINAKFEVFLKENNVDLGFVGLLHQPNGGFVPQWQFVLTD